MSDKEKLVELKKVLRECLHFNYDEFSCNMSLDVDLTAENLIAHGVTVQEWISVKDRLPEEHDSIFAKLYGTEKWLPGMFRTISNDVNACVEYEDGTRKVKTLHTFDGKWNLRGMGGKRVTHWMPLPQPPKGE